jgi:hypothetical protein
MEESIEEEGFQYIFFPAIIFIISDNRLSWREATVSSDSDTPNGAWVRLLWRIGK